MSERPTPDTDAFIASQDYSPTGHQWRNFTRKLERERDEAREDAARWESSSDAMERAGAEQARRADENREWALKAERERDEAREKAERYRLEANAIMMQRDEARELLRILVGLVAYGLGQSGEEWSLDAMRQATTAIQNAKSLEAAK